LAEILQNAGAEQILRASNCRSLVIVAESGGFPAAMEGQTAPARVKRRLKNSLGFAGAVYGIVFRRMLDERVSPLRGTSWAAFIGDWKHAERFAAVISLASKWRTIRVARGDRFVAVDPQELVNGELITLVLPIP